MKFDARSEKNISTLQPSAQKACREWLEKVRCAGIFAVVICGTRTFSEQEAIYNQPWDRKDNDGDGRVDEADEKVSKARAGSSVHNFGLAWDFVVFEGINEIGGTGKPLWESDKMTQAGKIALELKLDWGGAWKSFIDVPHIQMPGLSLSNLRAVFPKGWSLS